jgi:long-chain acyl-CoA synthetase
MVGGYCAVPVSQDISCRDKEYLLNLVDPAFSIESKELECFSSPDRDVIDFSPPQEEFAIFFTSGTTGRPKGVCHSLDALIGNAREFAFALGIGASSRMMHVFSMSYMAGFLNTILVPWVVGGCVVIGGKFSPAVALGFWKDLVNREINFVWLSPTMAAVLVRLNRNESLKHEIGGRQVTFFCGTGPLMTVVRDDFLKMTGHPLQESYGMSEVLLVSAQSRDESLRVASVGKVLPSVKVTTLRNEKGVDEVVIRSPFALLWYLTAEGRRYPVLSGNGMGSGDSGWVSKETGELFITGRIKDIIIRGGLNVSPAAIEEIISKVQGVVEVAVKGVAHAVWGEEVVAYIVVDDEGNKQYILESVNQLCIQNLGEGSRPDRVVFVQGLPKNDVGKIQKQLIEG